MLANSKPAPHHLAYPAVGDARFEVFHSPDDQSVIKRALGGMAQRRRPLRIDADRWPAASENLGGK
jgi:hypothetical protein